MGNGLASCRSSPANIDNSVKRLKLGEKHLCFPASVPWQHPGEVGASVTAGRRGVKIAWDLVQGMAAGCTGEHWTWLGFPCRSVREPSRRMPSLRFARASSVLPCRGIGKDAGAPRRMQEGGGDNWIGLLQGQRNSKRSRGAREDKNPQLSQDRNLCLTRSRAPLQLVRCPVPAGCKDELDDRLCRA